MRLLLTASLAAITVTALAVAQSPAVLSGTWHATQTYHRGTRDYSVDSTYVFKTAGDSFTGESVVGTTRRDIIHGTRQGDTITFTLKNPLSPDAPMQQYEGKLTAEGLSLQRTAIVAQPGYPYAVPANANRRPAPPPLLLHRISDDTVYHVPAALAHPPMPPFHPLPPNGLALTPPMGWNSWNKFAGSVTQADVKATADEIVSTGMRDAGYIYVNIDDTWEGTRDAQGNIQPNSKFPDMKALADYVHSKGLKLGIYSSPGPKTCAGYEGSYNHEAQDARTYAAWGIDYLKYDWCSASLVYRADEMKQAYEKMALALRATGRPIVFSLCQYGDLNVWEWGAQAGGNLWRTTGDISDHYDAMARIGFGQMGHEIYAAPGHWNDPDMLEIGNGGMNDDEYRTHMSLWSILAAPLLAGNDLTKMTPDILAILTNREVIAVDQDRLGKQGVRVAQQGQMETSLEIWKRQLAGGATAVALFNRSEQPAAMTATWSALGISQPAQVRDLWAHRNLPVTSSYTATVPAHGVILLRVQ